ncbi:hypothetical protein N789_05845 [Arenimonas oryziterrae DSM 21050 = YC6267]|uniref:Uncharacterized protein n=1 Tax=Arenimonas oryziterrae DSM 21050 = YC6267 TaxID=1121015 RepID=A0A091AQI4_9GAMM|nr:hypothetical protein N789_05845 [Arenimonas oryziterrae DSM 21050 = YC6267]
MPSPMNRITFFARACPAPRDCALAAPARNHQAGDSPWGRAMAGTVIGAVVVATAGAGDRETGVAAQPASPNTARRAIRKLDRMGKDKV